MKIIGETEHGFILEANKTEVANLKNFYSVGAPGLKTNIGEEIEVSKVYERYRALENLINSNDFRYALENIRKAEEILTPIHEVFERNKHIIKK